MSDKQFTLNLTTPSLKMFEVLCQSQIKCVLSVSYISFPMEEQARVHDIRILACTFAYVRNLLFVEITIRDLLHSISTVV